MNLYREAYKCLMEDNIVEKIKCIEQLRSDWKSGILSREDATNEKPVRVEIPGRPAKPDLIPVSELKQRKLGSELGRATLIHAISHIEFNAINLALDAVYRFRDMPDEYYSDWIKIAYEESYHFSLLSARLEQMGYHYGDFPAHNGLWEMVLKTDHDVLIRMALVPRVLEARGLDVTPGMIKRLEKAEDSETVEILKIILRDEIGHVRIGSHWFKSCCELRKIQPEKTFRDLLVEYMGGGIRGPFYMEGRLKAGFTQEEMDGLVAMLN